MTLSPSPTVESTAPIAGPLDWAGRQALPDGRSALREEHWTVTFDLVSANDLDAKAEPVEPPVIVILERGSLAWEHTVTRRNESGPFEMELEISQEDLRCSTVFCALDRVAADAHSGTALRLDRLGDRTRLGRCYASDGAWSVDERTLGLGTLLAKGPARAGSLSLGGAEFEELSVTVGFHKDAVPAFLEAG